MLVAGCKNSGTTIFAGDQSFYFLDDFGLHYDNTSSLPLDAFCHPVANFSINKYSSKKCSKRLTIFIYHTHLLKTFPDSNIDILNENTIYDDDAIPNFDYLHSINNEFYTCPTFNEAIGDGKKIKIFNIDKMWGLGTPEDLKYYLENYGK